MTHHLTPFINQWYKDWFRNEQLYHTWAHKHDLTYNELFTLDVLYITGGCTPAYIAEYLSISKQTVNSLLGRLEKRSLICREPSETDRRSCIIRFTDEGEQMARKILMELKEIEWRVFESFSEEEIKWMIDMNLRLTDRISEEMTKEDTV